MDFKLALYKVESGRYLASLISNIFRKSLCVCTIYTRATDALRASAHKESGNEIHNLKTKAFKTKYDESPQIFVFIIDFQSPMRFG